MDFFADNPEEKISSNKYKDVDWWDAQLLNSLYKQQKGIFLSVPIELLENKDYFFYITKTFPIFQVYGYFSPEVKEDKDVIDYVTSHLIKTEHIYLLPKKYLIDKSFLLDVLSKRPRLYEQIDVSLKRDIDYNITLLSCQKEKFCFDKIYKEVFNSHEFLEALLNELRNKTIALNDFFLQLPTSTQDELSKLDSKEREQYFCSSTSSYILQQKLIKNLQEKDIVEKKHKI